MKRLRWKWQDLLDKGLGRRVVPGAAGEGRILVYHGVTEHARTDINARFISTQLFRQQMEWLKMHARIVSVADYFAGKRDPDKLTVALTFDDGYRNNYREVVPILREMKLPATFFVTAIRAVGYDFLWPDALDLYKLSGPSRLEFENRVYQKRGNEYRHGRESLKDTLRNSDWKLKAAFLEQHIDVDKIRQDAALLPYWELMPESEIRKIAEDPLFEIGAHGLYHNCLGRISHERATTELAESKAWLENVTQKPVRELAWPDNSKTDALVDAAQKMGYERQLAVNMHGSEQPDMRPRFGINPYISLNNQLRAIIKGEY